MHGFLGGTTFQDNFAPGKRLACRSVARTPDLSQGWEQRRVIPAALRVLVQGALHVRQESSWRNEGEEGGHEVTDLPLNARSPVRS